MTEHTDLQRLAEGATKRIEVRPTNWPTESLFVIGDQETTGRGLQMLTVDALFHAAASPDRILSLLQEIERLSKEAEWISLADQAPEIGGTYLFYQPRYNRVYCDGYCGRESDLRGVTDWKPLPQPPTPGSPS